MFLPYNHLKTGTWRRITDRECVICRRTEVTVCGDEYACERCMYVTAAADVFFPKEELVPSCITRCRGCGAYHQVGQCRICFSRVIDVYWRETPKSMHYRLVEAFMEIIEKKGGIKLARSTGTMSLADRQHRARLILEECLETIREGLGLNLRYMPEKVDSDTPFYEIGSGDPVALADGVFDSKVVLTGTLVHFGIPDTEGQRLVDYNNLEKFKVGYRFDNGKLVKPPGHLPPDLGGWLSRVLLGA